MAVVDRGAELRAELVHSGLAPRTVALYLRTASTAEQWFAAQGWDLGTAAAEQVAAYADTKPSTFATRNLLRAVLTRYWTMSGHPRPPLRALRVPPKPAMVCRALEELDARILAKAARARGDRMGMAVIFGMYQAMRREEIACARWDSLRSDGWITIVGKGTKTRTIPLHPVTVETLEDYPRLSEWVFPGRLGGHVNPTTIWEWVRIVAEEAGVGRVRCHWTRHTALATQNDATGDLRTVQAFAGHSRPETTAGYTRATGRRLKAAVLAIDY
ncbi:MAG: site-specific integrase [Chloroflexi bacterium]|nr:site-specific integrase [Chloroflexota bacterium]